MTNLTMNSRSKWIVFAVLISIAFGLFIQRGFAEDQTVAPSESDALCKEFIAKGHAEGVQNYLEACGNPTWTFGPLELTPSEPKPNQP